MKFRFGYDDSLDVIGVHLVGGILGSLLLGLFADKAVNSAGRDGLFHGGGLSLLGDQAVAVLATLIFSFVLTFVIAQALGKVLPGGLRINEEDEETGMDLSLHSEVAYAPDRV
jgi:Amt family ammonium transporter